jgi:hypothetical protein
MSIKSESMPNLLNFRPQVLENDVKLSFTKIHQGHCSRVRGPGPFLLSIVLSRIYIDISVTLIMYPYAYRINDLLIYFILLDTEMVIYHFIAD